MTNKPPEMPRKMKLWRDASIDECRRNQNEDQETQDIYSEGVNQAIDLCTPVVEYWKERAEKAEERSDWFDNLVKRACIGTEKTPSLRSYIEQLEKELQALKEDIYELAKAIRKEIKI